MKSIVVIGAGPGGVAFAQTLSKLLPASEAKVTVIEKQNFYFHVFGSLRAMVDKAYIQKLFVPLDFAFQNNVQLKRATVTSIDYDRRTVNYTQSILNSQDEPESIKYDYLVIATGSSYPSPIKPSSTDSKVMEKVMIQTTENIKNADRILIIGGGAVGIEMAGELKSFYPNKKIMLMDGNTDLLSNQNVPKMKKRLEQKLKKCGVELFLGERFHEKILSHEFGTRSNVTEKGLTIESDARIVCVGMKPNVGLMNDTTCLEGKYIKVKETMEVDHRDEKYKQVFVLGDASNHPTPKMGYWAGEQGKHLAKSIAVNLQKGKRYKPFDGPSVEVLIIPIGPKGGVTQLPFFGGVTVGDFFTRNVKSKDLMAGMVWKNLNAKMP